MKIIDEQLPMRSPTELKNNNLMSQVVSIMQNWQIKSWDFSLTSSALLRVEYSVVKEDPDPWLLDDKLLVKHKVFVSNPVWRVFPRFRLEGETSDSLFLINSFDLCDESLCWWVETWERLPWHVTSPYISMFAVDGLLMKFKRSAY